jgi:hypothetical protein
MLQCVCVGACSCVRAKTMNVHSKRKCCDETKSEIKSNGAAQGP